MSIRSAMSNNSSRYPLTHQSSNATASSHSTSLLFVVLDSLYYTAGEKINGEILLNIPHDHPESSLKLISRGTEKIKVSSLSKTNIIYSLESSVKTWDKMTPAGQYIFPFTFKLPAFSPATFNYVGEDEQGTELMAEVSYEVICALEFPSDEERNMTHSRNINVRNTMSKTQSNILWETNELIKGMCCSSKGTTFFKVLVKRDQHPQTDSVVMFKLETDNNNCAASISKIKSQIKMELELQLEGRTYTSFVVFNKNSKDTWISSARSSFVMEKELEFESGIFFEPGINPSSNNTGNISCRYFIEFYVEYDAKLKNPVCLKIPMQVDPKFNDLRENPTVPENWSPRESPVYSAFVDESMSKNSQVINLFID